MTITRSGSQAHVKGPADYFTGDVTIEWQFDRDDPARLAGALVRFRGWRAQRLAHDPLGQTLVATHKKRPDVSAGPSLLPSHAKAREDPNL